ncbi:hypothetical protein DSO57_1038321 [Entomophthora muscae]|uniref:Uncharacterized protein n=1 Tax=Entomophthora muscae TaxID=34485 RepID=A0ACC2RDH8_9FUNG|nr:hypothetical protein DSO57_1038321 [Entomophthora muscae]
MVQLGMHGKVASVRVLTNVAGNQCDAFDNFGKQGRATTQKGRKKVKRGTFTGAILAVLAKGFVYYQTNPDFTNGYKYIHILDELLNVVNAAICHVLIFPSMGYFKDKSLSSAFAL